ncbi:MAG: trans-sialidase [Nitrosopumilaceae archaeon]
MAKAKAPTKKDLEAKVAELEAKLAKLSAKAGETAQKAPPPPPKPAEAKPAEAPKPAEQKAAPPATLAQALENAWQNYPAGNNTHYYKEHATGFTPGPNRYYGRLIAPVGKAPTQDWSLQKSKVPGYTQPSNQYFATRARLAYHPQDKTFTGYGFVVEGAAAQAQQVQAEPPKSQKGTLPKGF